jgi:hypothetical protein
MYRKDEIDANLIQDYPYAQYSYNAALARMLGSAFLNEEELQAIFRDDSFALYGNKLAHS